MARTSPACPCHPYGIAALYRFDESQSINLLRIKTYLLLKHLRIPAGNGRHDGDVITVFYRRIEVAHEPYIFIV